MRKTYLRRGFSSSDLVIVAAIIGILIALLLPAIQAAREAARRTQCADNLKQIALAMHMNHAARNEFPTSCESKVPMGGGKEVNGWSFLVQLLPYLEYASLYERLGEGDGIKLGYPDDRDPGRSAKIEQMGNTLVPIYCCASYQGPKFSDPAKQAGALTNYKAIGATHAGSLNRAWDPKAKTLYAPDGGTHPDGALPPKMAVRMHDFTDGSSNTVLVAESTEPVHSRWIRGDECVVVGFPEKGQDTATSFVIPAGESYYAPKGYVPGQYGAESKVTIRSFAAWNYGAPALGGDGTYGGTVGQIPSFPATAATERGISSSHPGIIHHAFADGAVHSVSKQVDPSLYFFLLTRAGRDPGDFTVEER